MTGGIIDTAHFYPIPGAYHLDTLAQPYQIPVYKGCSRQETDTKAGETPPPDRQKLLKRARAKYLTNGIVLRLVDQRSELTKSYWRTYHCAERIVVTGGEEESRYCKNRWCLVCNRIKTAEMINRHLEPIRSFANPHFVTLTIPNVQQAHLRQSIKGMNKNLTNIRRRLKRQGIEGRGIRKMECTFNSTRNDYHPHLHLIVEGREFAEGIVREWLKTYKSADLRAQEIRKADEGSIKELFKYFTKLISTKRGEREIYADVLDTMFQAVKGTRVFQGWGYKAENLKEENPEAMKMAEEIEEMQLYQWSQDLADWVNVETGEALTGYIPTKGMRDLVENRIKGSYNQRGRPPDRSHKRPM